MGWVKFNNIYSSNGSGRTAIDSSFDLVVQTPPTETYPERDIETVHITGRNGDIFLDKDSYKNGTRVYNFAVRFPNELASDFNNITRKVTSWLHSAKGYAILEDSYSPDVYRKALFKNAGSYVNAYDQATAFEVEFDCKPQKFLKAYAEPLEIPYTDLYSDWYTVENPTDQIALPIIGPSVIIPTTNHVPYLLALVNGRSVKWFRYEDGDVSLNTDTTRYAWKNKTLTEDSIVYTAQSSPEAGQKIFADPELTDEVSTITSVKTNLTLWQIIICKNKTNYQSDDYWIIDIDNDYDECNRITINSEYMECYDETGSDIVLKNQYVTITGTEGFPRLYPGNNYIKFLDPRVTPPTNPIPLIRNYWYL